MILDSTLHSYTVYKYILLYMYLFLFGSISGYIIEVLYRRYVSVKRWVNPGFNKGPWIPLYGCGVVIMSAITTSLVSIFHSNGIALYNPHDLYNTGVGHGATFYDLIPIFVMGFGMTLIELIAGLVFVKGFKVRLWDYSNVKHNFMGIICPLFSIIWLVVSALFYYGLSPFITNKATNDVVNILMPKDDTFPKIYIVLILGIVYGFLIYDFVQSMGLFNRVSRMAKKLGSIIHYDEFNEDRSRFNKEALSQIDDMLPDKLRDALEKFRSRDSKKTISYRIKRFLYIDPDKTKDDNFDSSGRPISDEIDEKDSKNL